MTFTDLSFAQIRCDVPATGIARITMDRPEKRNAQGVVMTYELDEAFKAACHADDISVIILAGSGDHFNSGHDLSGAERVMPTASESRALWGQYHGEGWEGFYAREKEIYFEITERWRNAPKPTIAQVQGSCVMGGNMLAWACDLIICADDARFIDTSANLSVPGIEWSGYPWELGVRKAKEWLFRGGAVSAQEAERRGMVNHVVGRSELTDFTLKLAAEIAQKDRFTLKLMKEAINAAQDAMGRREAMAHAFALHQIGHLQNMLRHGLMVNIETLPEGIRDQMQRSMRDWTSGRRPGHGA